MKEMRAMAYESNIVPTQRLMAEELDTQLLPDFETAPEKRRTGFDQRNVRVLQEDEDALAKRQIALFQGGLITKAEGRKAVGKETSTEDEFSVLPYTLTVIPAGQSADASAGQTQPPAQTIAKAWQPAELKISRRDVALLRALNADERHLTGVFAKELHAHFNRLGDLAAAAYAARKKSQVLELVGARSNGHGRKGPGDLLHPPTGEGAGDSIVVEQILYAVNAKPLDYKAHYLRTLETTVNSINAKLGLGINLSDSMEREIVAAGGKRMGLVDITEQARDSLFKALAEGRDAGEGADAMARRIRDQVAAGPWSSSEIRSRVIARTETKFAQNKSSIEAAKGGAGIVGMTMIDAQLGPTDAECEAIDGQEVSFEDAEQLIAEEHPNGTRACIPRMGEE
jgi:hypothetical protein